MIGASIATAVSQQSEATFEISRSVEDAAKSANAVTGEVGRVNKSASNTGKASGAVLQSARLLSQQSKVLEGEVAKFLTMVRAA